jgi:hypothetical protein
MTSPVLNEQELAELLRVPAKTVAALVARSDLPRFFVDGKMRFLSSRVLAWCERHEGSDIVPPEAPVAPPVAPSSSETPRLPRAKEGEHPWVDEESLDALAKGAGDPQRNLDRLKLRDALLELNDGLLGGLTRLSGGRLHPHNDERSRTTPWRLEPGSEERIDAISIAWGSGEHAPPRFEDRPHIEVELSKGELRVALETAQRAFEPPLDAAAIDALADAGIAVELEPDGRPSVFAKVYSLPTPAPPVGTIVARLESDLERLVSLWARLA